MLCTLLYVESDIALASEEELMTDIERLQKSVTTSFTLQLSERGKHLELQQSLHLKGN